MLSKCIDIGTVSEITDLTMDELKELETIDV